MRCIFSCRLDAFHSKRVNSHGCVDGTGALASVYVAHNYRLFVRCSFASDYRLLFCTSAEHRSTTGSWLIDPILTSLTNNPQSKSLFPCSLIINPDSSSRDPNDRMEKCNRIDCLCALTIKIEAIHKSQFVSAV